MNTYLISSQTNYGLMVHVVNESTPDKARKVAEKMGAWPGAAVTEIDTKTRGMVAYEQPSGG